MKLGLVQSHIEWDDKKANREKALESVKKAKENGVELLLFPEMTFTGFSMNVNSISEEKEEPDGTIAFMKKIAQDYGINIGAGWAERAGKKGKNHYTIISSEGEIVLDYVKMHPFSYAGENLHYESGDSYEVAEIAGIPMTAFICYDLRFPMNFWKASEKAHLIIVPANWPKRRIEQWKVLLRARAIENQVYIAAINCVGTIGEVEYSGASCVINPKGEVLALSEDEETLLIVEINDDVEEQRKKFPVHKDRRPEER